MSVAAFEAASQLALAGRYLASQVLTVRARAVAGREAGESATAGAGHWNEQAGRERLTEAVRQMVPTPPPTATAFARQTWAEERAALEAALWAKE